MVTMSKMIMRSKGLCVFAGNGESVVGVDERVDDQAFLDNMEFKKLC